MGKKREKAGRPDQMARALGHPLRVRILRQLEKGPSGPKRMAESMGENLANVSYHTKALLEFGCIELVETTPARGAVEHIYRLKPQGSVGTATWKEAPQALRTHFAGTALAGFASRAVEALDAGTIESREGSGIVWLPLDVDEQGWTELVKLLADFEQRFEAVADKCAKRVKDPSERIPVIAAVSAFEVAREQGGTS